MEQNNLNAEIWGPHFWFFLHTIAYRYPEFPNEVTKRKYYDLIQNLPLFIPNEKIGDTLSEFLVKYPITPYLDSRESFMLWINFIHNRFNVYLGKKQITVFEGIDRYLAKYSPEKLIKYDTILYKKHIIYSIIIILLLGIGYWNLK